MDAARQQAEVIGLQNPQGQGGQQQGETGNGDANIGTGKDVMPGEEEFSGN
jgi:hypothetical protein